MLGRNFLLTLPLLIRDCITLRLLAEKMCVKSHCYYIFLHSLMVNSLR
ncbi:Uncharacterised protein [Vibrio cholerae]|nr:Uncharacterised protein [Vibrio cholerae]